MPVTKVTLLQSAESILTMFDVKLAQRALENLQSSGVTVRLGVRVVQVTEKEVVLLRGKGGEERMAYGLVVWSCGNQPRPFVRSLVAQIEGQQGLQMGRGAKLAVDGYLRVIGARDVFAAGDCSLLVEGPLPSTAQVAGQQGAYLAHLINRKLDPGLGGVGSNSIPPGRTLEPPKLLGLPLGPARTESYRTFSFFSLGLMAYVGNEAAVTQFEVEAGEGNVGFKLYGTLAFLLWRSVYITKQVSLRNRVLILFDWLKTRVFGRDTSMF